MRLKLSDVHIAYSSNSIQAELEKFGSRAREVSEQNWRSIQRNRPAEPNNSAIYWRSMRRKLERFIVGRLLVHDMYIYIYICIYNIYIIENARMLLFSSHGISAPGYLITRVSSGGCRRLGDIT